MNRRNFLTLGTARRETPAPCFTNDGAVQTPPIFARRSDTGLESYTGAWTYKEAAHLLRRAMVGPTDADIRKALSDGHDKTVIDLLKPFSPPMTLIADWAGQDPQIRPASQDQAVFQAWQDERFRRRETILKWWLNTITTSPISIQERMTMLWHNHFTSEMEVVNYAELMLTQNQLLRSNILGNFKQLVKDVTVDLAMLVYLDGIKNSKQGNRDNINENYARELMELFTCGVIDWDGNPNYTETDIREAARALSGYTLTPSSKGALYTGLTSTFVLFLWDSGSKTFMGRTGVWKANDIVDIIFEERADQVAKFACEKIYRALVYHIPDRVVIAEMAATLRANNWELRPVVDQLLRSAHFFDETNIGAMDKSPVDYMVGMIRSVALANVPDFTAGTGRNTRDLSSRLATLGMTLLDPPNVKGWPAGRTWISTSTLPVRQKFAIDVAAGALKFRNAVVYTFDPVAFAKTFPDYDDIHKLSANMALFLLNTEPSALETTSLYEALLDGGKDYEWDIDDPDQKAGDRIRKFLNAVAQLAKFQLY